MSRVIGVPRRRSSSHGSSSILWQLPRSCRGPPRSLAVLCWAGLSRASASDIFSDLCLFVSIRAHRCGWSSVVLWGSLELRARARHMIGPCQTSVLRTSVYARLCSSIWNIRTLRTPLSCGRLLILEPLICGNLRTIQSSLTVACRGDSSCSAFGVSCAELWCLLMSPPRRATTGCRCMPTGGHHHHLGIDEAEAQAIGSWTELTSSGADDSLVVRASPCLDIMRALRFTRVGKSSSMSLRRCCTSLRRVRGLVLRAMVCSSLAAFFGHRSSSATTSASASW